MLFDKVLILFFKIFSYRYYKRKYTLNNNFRFNGYFIRFYGDGNIISGEDTYIGFFSFISVIKGTTVTFGHNVSISHNVRIYTSSMDTGVFINKGIKQQTVGNVKIGSNVLIGANVFICPGVTIGDNVIVGANSVVTSDVNSYCVVGGAPAKVLKKYEKNS